MDIVEAVDSTELKLFLASPGGLDDFRAAARESADRLRRNLAIPLKVGLELVGWEDLAPGYGRPQAVINPALDECNVLIGILGPKLGTPTGEAESGFVEEFDRMAARAKAGEAVTVFLYVLEAPAEQRDDPGRELSRVLTFLEGLRAEVLYKPVRNVDHFATELTRDLVWLLSGAAGEREAEEDRSAVSAPPELLREQPEQETDGEASAQLRALLGEAAEALPQAPESFSADPFALARLELWLSTWQSWLYDNHVLETHALNRVYRRREEVAIAPLEGRQVLRAICADTGLAPGWALLEPETAFADLLAISFGDGDPVVRAGAFGLLERETLQDWFARTDVELDVGTFFGEMPRFAADTTERVR